MTLLAHFMSMLVNQCIDRGIPRTSLPSRLHMRRRKDPYSCLLLLEAKTATSKFNKPRVFCELAEGSAEIFTSQFKTHSSSLAISKGSLRAVPLATCTICNPVFVMSHRWQLLTNEITSNVLLHHAIANSTFTASFLTF